MSCTIPIWPCLPITSKGAVYAGNNITITAAGQISATDTTLPAASTTILGGIYLGSDAENTVATNSPTNTATRSYPLQNDANGKAVVNVPWETNTNTVNIHIAPVFLFSNNISSDTNLLNSFNKISCNSNLFLILLI